MFSVQEIELLKQSWQHIAGPGSYFGRDLYFQLLKNEPGLAKAIDLDPSKPETWERSLEFIEEGRRIADLFNRMIPGLTPRSTKFDLRPDIRRVGDAHQQLKITLRNESFCLFKSYILTLVNDCPIPTETSMSVGIGLIGTHGTHRWSQHNKSDSGVRNRAWERLICFIIAELKAAYEENRHGKRRNALDGVGTGVVQRSDVNVRLAADKLELMPLMKDRSPLCL